MLEQVFNERFLTRQPTGREVDEITKTVRQQGPSVRGNDLLKWFLDKTTAREAEAEEEE